MHGGGREGVLAAAAADHPLAGSIGVYLFYVQHQYEDTYWRYRESWNYFAAGLEGASHLVMPKPLQWLTANIGLHHIHHVSSRIPNYNLQRCYDSHPELRDVTKLTLWQSVKTLRLTLWDEDGKGWSASANCATRPRLMQQGGGAEQIQATKPEAVAAHLALAVAGPWQFAPTSLCP